jgi:hypothetical protein
MFHAEFVNGVRVDERRNPLNTRQGIETVLNLFDPSVGAIT